MRFRFSVLLAATALLGTGLAPPAIAAQPTPPPNLPPNLPPVTPLPPAREWSATSRSGVFTTAITT